MTCEFRRRVGKHLLDIHHQHNTPVTRHARREHGGDTRTFKFMGIDHIQPMIRKGEFEIYILQRETLWTYMLDTSAPKGLNEQLNISCYI